MFTSATETEKKALLSYINAIKGDEDEEEKQHPVTKPVASLQLVPETAESMFNAFYSKTYALALDLSQIWAKDD